MLYKRSKNQYRYEFYQDLKTILVIHDLDEYSNIEKSELKNFGVDINKKLKGDMLNIYDVSSYDVDSILIINKPGNKISGTLMKRTAFKDNKNKVTVFDQSESENIDYNPAVDSLNNIISNLLS